MMSTPSVPALLPGEVQPGGSYCSALPTLGFLTMKNPLPGTVPIRPTACGSGLDRQGEIIGTNVSIPYPGDLSKYRSIPFINCLEWPTHDTERKTKPTHKHQPEAEQDMRCAEEIAEYFTAENDEGYRQWAEKKKKQQEEITKKTQPQQQTCTEILHRQRQSPVHFMPSRLQTTNQAYGSYLDLAPKHPAVYPLPARQSPVPIELEVRFEKSNISGHARVTNHPFLFNQQQPQQQMNTISKTASLINPNCGTYREIPKSCQTPTRTQPYPTACTAARGTDDEREKGFTFPVYSRTGLEVNHPVSSSSNISPHIPKHAIPGKVLCVPSRPRKNMVHTPYCLRLPRDPRINPGYLADRHIVYEAVQLPHILS